jgi:hypothetical protein
MEGKLYKSSRAFGKIIQLSNFIQSLTNQLNQIKNVQSELKVEKFYSIWFKVQKKLKPKFLKSQSF